MLLPRRIRLGGGRVGMDDVASLRGEAGVQERGHRDEHLGTCGCSLWYMHGVAASGRNGCSLEYTCGRGL